MRRLPAAVAAACLVLTGCGVTMPHTGPVHVTTATGADRDDGSVTIDPRRPGKGDTPDQIVKGFLDAMRATPAITTTVAREFLTTEARDSWQPTGMVIYNAVLTPRVLASRGTEEAQATEVEATLTNAVRTDPRGTWLGPVSPAESTVGFGMEREDGEWRISAPPPYLLVPQKWFAQRFQQASLYFFDPSGTVLVPEPVFVPQGNQFASTLVKGLLQGPTLGLTEQNYLPDGLRSFSVPVSASGVAKIELTSDTGDAAMPTSDQSELMVAQLAWTLQQDPTISSFKVTIDDRAVQLPGETEFDVQHGHEYAPYVAGSSTQLFGLEDGRMVGGSPQNLETVTGPFGTGDYSLRTVSADLRAEYVAGVSESGGTLWLAPVKDTGVIPRAPITNGEDLLRPAWDFTGRLWEVDRRKTGAVVSYLVKDQMREVEVTGISGEDVKDFLVSRDGSRLIAVIRKDAEQDSIVVSRILTTGDGQVQQVLPAHDISDPAGEGQIRDIAWRSPTSLVILRPVSRDLFRVGTASVDGATGFDSLSVPVKDDVVSIAGTPNDEQTIYTFARRDATDDVPAHAVLGDLAGEQADQIVLDPRVTMLAYVG